VKPKISLVIPTLNEEASLPLLLQRIPKCVGEVIVVDGHSTDRTVQIARDHGCRVLFDGLGKGSALRRGATKSTGDYVIMIDADCSNQISELRRLIKGLDQGYDICMGSRFMPGGGSSDITLARKLGNRFFIFLVNLLFASHYTDLCYGYRSLTRDAFNRLQLTSDGFSIETEMSIKAAKQRMRVLEVPSFEKKREGGDSKLSTVSDGWRILKKILEEAFRNG
jgi:glycosyltransferase involved in cell wall biosynthesis